MLLLIVVWQHVAMKPLSQSKAVVAVVASVQRHLFTCECCQVELLLCARLQQADPHLVLLTPHRSAQKLRGLKWGKSCSAFLWGINMHWCFSALYASVIALHSWHSAWLSVWVGGQLWHL